MQCSVEKFPPSRNGCVVTGFSPTTFHSIKKQLEGESRQTDSRSRKKRQTATEEQNTAEKKRQAHRLRVLTRHVTGMPFGNSLPQKIQCRRCHPAGTCIVVYAISLRPEIERNVDIFYFFFYHRLGFMVLKKKLRRSKTV